MCSVETYSSLSSRISPSASRRTRTSSLDGPEDSPPVLTVGSASRAAFASERTAARFGQRAGGGDRLLGLDGESVGLHQKKEISVGETQIIAHRGRGPARSDG